MKAKRFLYLLLILFLCSNAIRAQQALGVYAGSVTNRFEGDRVSKLFDVGFRMHSSMSAGLVLDLPIKEDVYITFMPGYKDISGTIFENNEEYIEQIEQGIEEPTVPKTIDISFLEFDFVAFPVLLKIISNNTKWQFMAGIETQVRVKSNLDLFKTGETINIDSYVKPINFSAIFGLGYRFNIKKARFSIDLMYTQGLNNLSSGQELPNGSVPRVKPTTGETKLTWYFLNKKEKSK